MKKLALTFATLGLLAAPVLACPNMEDKPAEVAAPRTAEKAKEQPKAKEAPAKEAPKAKDAPATAKKAPDKAPEKKADKVSSR